MPTLTFKCPGCGDMHVVPGDRWRITGTTPQNVTCAPSLHCTCGHFVAGQPQPPDGTCWCKWNREHPDQPGPECYRCHSFIRGGRIEFLADCSHALAGKTVPVPADAKVTA